MEPHQAVRRRATVLLLEVVVLELDVPRPTTVPHPPGVVVSVVVSEAVPEVVLEVVHLRRHTVRQHLAVHCPIMVLPLVAVTPEGVCLLLATVLLVSVAGTFGLLICLFCVFS